MDCYATHIPMLATVVLMSEGPMLELGAGYYSTYMLHEISKVQNRPLFTLEEKPDFIKEFEKFRTHLHSVQLVNEWKHCPILDKFHWGMVLVDHAPGERRKFDIKRLADRADYLVVHDSEEGGYDYETVLPDFKYRFDYKVVRPWTTVVSNRYPLGCLNEL